MAVKRITVRALRGEAARYAKPETEKEAAILAAATRLFGDKGYDGARTAEIAAAAGVTERTLFRYFPSKEDLYRRVMFPALLIATVPEELARIGRLFGASRESFDAWHRAILTGRLAAAKRSAPQLRLLLAGMLTDPALRRRVIELWKENLWSTAVATMKRFQSNGALRRDVAPEVLARAVISLNLGYIFARTLLAPDGDWDDAAEIDATIDVMLRGARKSN
jgi:TetR/AcrR family transcriptional regulator